MLVTGQREQHAAAGCYDPSPPGVHLISLIMEYIYSLYYRGYSGLDLPVTVSYVQSPQYVSQWFETLVL